jgi:mRNA-degrading endonuclease HigB of HigAB toxin-antitoxin module
MASCGRLAIGLGRCNRLIAQFTYKTNRVFILHILTHVDYSKGGWKR